MTYIIAEKTLTDIADATRLMVGTKQKMTPAEIVYWLGRVTYIPQGIASTSVDLGAMGLSTKAVGVLPDVQVGTASVSVDLALLGLETSAVGVLQEG